MSEDQIAVQADESPAFQVPVTCDMKSEEVQNIIFKEYDARYAELMAIEWFRLPEMVFNHKDEDDAPHRDLVKFTSGEGQRARFDAIVASLKYLTSKYGIVGLTANQIGQEEHVWVMNTPQGIMYVFINPRVQFSGKKKISKDEVCPSFIGVCRDVESWSVAKITYLDENYVERTLKFHNDDAFCLSQLSTMDSFYREGIHWNETKDGWGQETETHQYPVRMEAGQQVLPHEMLLSPVFDTQGKVLGTVTEVTRDQQIKIKMSKSVIEANLEGLSVWNTAYVAKGIIFLINMVIHEEPKNDDTANIGSEVV